ncbi:MAG TPA: Gfo/Idh/MocA family oxidoreductase [Vicinamibacterales bacterium]|jgi:predicted dehydrogenase
MATSADLRVAVIGYSLAGEVFHAPLVATTPGMRLVGVVTGNAERAQRVRDRYGDVHVFPTAARLWERARDLDLVVVASPNSTHVPLALDALAAGLSVVVDKPFAASAADARRVVDEAGRRGLLLTVFQNRRWDGDFLTVRRLVEDGRLGTITRFESRFERWRPTPRIGWRESSEPADAGGVLFDLGPHLIDQALQLFGPATAVYAELDRRRPHVVVDDDVFVALVHECGVRSHLWMSAVAPQAGPRFRLLGSQAGYTKFGLDPQEAMLKDGARPGDPGYGEDPENVWGVVVDGEGRTARVRTIPGSYRTFYEGVAAALRTGTAPPVDPLDAVAGLEIIESCRRMTARTEHLSS